MRSADRELADEWRQAVIRSWGWRPAKNQAGASSDHAPGEAGGLFVGCDELPRHRAYMKPKKKEPGKFRAAREKIAADLAHDLGLCIPPVLLAQRNDAKSNEEEHVCVSLVLYPKQWSWKQLRPKIEQNSDTRIAELAEQMMPEVAGLALAFDTWIGQWDHGDHPHNIVFGYDPKAPEEEHSFVFLDFAFSMGLDGRWSDERYKIIEEAKFPKLMRDSIGQSEIEDGIKAIEELPDQAILDVVDRIPGTHIDSADRQLIKDALCFRKGEISKVLIGGQQST